MSEHADKLKESQSTSITSPISQQRQYGSAFQLVDNRPVAVAQRKMQEAINNSPHVQQLKAKQAVINNHNPEITQRKENSGKGSSQPTQKKANNTGLPDKLKTGVENLSGISMDDVKVHYNSARPAQLQAHAYAQGTDIHLASGQEKHLPHEAWHVVQQKQGRVTATMQMKGGVNVNDDKGLEQEADVMGQRAVQLKISTPISLITDTSANSVVQRIWIPDAEHNERWDTLIDGVQWYKDDKNRLWFTSENKKYAFWQGQVHSYTMEEWDKIEEDIQKPKPDHTNAIEKMEVFRGKKSEMKNIGSSRPKFVYFFNAAGDFTQNKSEAVFMIDTGMKKEEVANYQKVRKMGVRVPHIYGWSAEGPIVQFLPNQVTVTSLMGGIAKGVSGIINRLKIIKQWKPAAWKAALVDLNILIATGYHSADLQFMVDNDGGHIYVMDMEEDKPAFFDGTPDRGLLEAKEIIEAAVNNV